MEQTVLSVQGMSCGHCVKAVEGTVSELSGVKSVKVNLESATVEVEYDESKVSLETIKESIDDQGYDVA
ncbi:copper chaperone CopZ [Priestia flexa]|jgi:copper chaperone|uniref:Copper chaperone CopZ n=1 Tax=Priestia flexa TaxID=86664 RepID=A0A8I1SNX2_9BACI|nr:copper chaperone CopZ [Priestia flexa]MBN8251826.1 copper chaperone CopZ [Priestia flexa]MBN8436322.1 copper chaperone CopZ [Priestia flexa]MCA0968907.1 copper chaperone CopZ [Priestia flexa]RIV14133.1 copper chaperone [Priestia flexa]UIR28704.1 copper chaperone CopZ [Priestia flexa]